MFNKIKKEWLFIFFILAGSLIFFDLVGINYSGITGTQIAQTNIDAVRQAFENIFNILFQGFAKPLFDVFHLPTTGIVAIRIFIGLFLFAIIFPVLSKTNIFGDKSDKKIQTRVGVVAGLIALISAAFIPEEILVLYFGDGYVNIFSSLLGFVFVIGTSLLMIYGVSKIPGDDPANNKGKSVAAGIGYLVVLFVILYVVEVARRHVVLGLQTVFDITWAILLLVCMIQFFRYTFYYPLIGLGGSGSPATTPPKDIDDVGELKKYLQAHIKEQERLLKIIRNNWNNPRVVIDASNDFSVILGEEISKVSGVKATVFGKLGATKGVKPSTILTTIDTKNKRLISNLTSLKTLFPPAVPLPLNVTAINNKINEIEVDLNTKKAEMSRL